MQSCYFSRVKEAMRDRVQRMMRKALVPMLAGLALAACTDRERLTFPAETDGHGPITFIDTPDRPEITVPAGPGTPLNGKTIDPDGVDTVYIVLLGGNENFPPFSTGNRDTVHFGVTINTTGLGGDTMFVLVFGTDKQGNRGDTAIRRIAVSR